ncbi:type II secretion system minor pseudopilin GspK [Noviherbaspirillum sedimenti]|uniref:Type II secretion system protein K n=1 Tax=Noviherbaspirillum sedimenti TaxID=2320865 RepID=A0A3A3G4K0_9BURK|nr:type II secretion system minor pseudopilin GspK [Noviherbaspirillum sedimenti]RJG03408.1 general secretion pathway protein GspK [Noviherbaspirillum sedimenti]
MKRPVPELWRQRGVAVVTALLLTTLAITIVASLFWQQQVQVRSIENQRLQLQKQWILRGALDWSALILRADAANSGPDHLGEPWAVPLADTRLDQYVENGKADSDAGDATLSGDIIDAQSRFNLNNMASGGQIKAAEVAVLRNLLAELRMNPGLAQAAAEAVAAGQPKASVSGAPVQVAGAGANRPRPLRIEYVDDLLSVPGFTPAIVKQLQDFVVVLPGTTKINANTAPVEVLAAKLQTIDTLSSADATSLVASRDQAYLKDKCDIALRLGKTNMDCEALDIQTGYFLVNGKVSMNRAGLAVQALMKREGATMPRVIWIREN